MALVPVSRADKAADKEAAAILASLSRAGEAAIEQTLQDTVLILRADSALLYHLNALLHNEEWKGVLKASLNRAPTDDRDSGEQPAKEGRKLRQGARKFKQLARQRAGETLCTELCPLAASPLLPLPRPS